MIEIYLCCLERLKEKNTHTFQIVLLEWQIDQVLCTVSLSAYVSVITTRKSDAETV